jgi:Fe-S cluster biogenesis protein NfuA
LRFLGFAIWGKIAIVEVRDRSLYLEMSGGCQGCAASQLTLRQGFERMVRKIVPELVDIIDTTDHTAGARPFYRQVNA